MVCPILVITYTLLEHMNILEGSGIAALVSIQFASMRFWELAKLLSVALSSLQAKGPSNRSRNLRHASSTQVGGIPPEELWFAKNPLQS